MNNLENLQNKVGNLKDKMDRLNIITKDLNGKARSETGLAAKYVQAASPPRGSSFVDLSEVDVIFDDLELKSTGGTSFL